jgi:hypothetical protein
MEHPYMTFMTIVFLIACGTSVLNQIIALFKKPDPAPTVNMKVELPTEYEGSNVETKETLN